jgi:lipopolysaccharide export system ATP-binding protein
MPDSNAGNVKKTLRAEGLIKKYKKRTVVKGVNVEVSQGEVVGLLGPNGAGKTTTFYMIVGMISPNEGKVFLDNEEITNLAMYKRARRGVGYLPQEASVFRKLSVEDNLMAVLQLLDMTDSARKERVEQLLSDFNIAHIRKSKGYMLSGGERRRTEIARALATDPKFILLDEPFAGIDPIAVEEIMKIVATLRDKGIGVLVTDHNVHETLSITDRSYLLFEGQILKAGTAEFLANDPEARKLYLGENFKLDRYE